MVTGRSTIIVSLAFLALIAGTTAHAYRVYYWLDENGVPNFSQMQPDEKPPGLRTI